MTMAILIKLDERGGFTCGDTTTGRASYAYPTSECAIGARHDPHGVAVCMLQRSDAFCAVILKLDIQLPPFVTEYHARLMADLKGESPCPSS